VAPTFCAECGNRDLVYLRFRFTAFGLLSIKPCLRLPAHRKFFELLQANQSPVAQEALNRIAAYNAIEAECRDLTPDARYAQTPVRQKNQPALAALHGRLQQTRLRTAPHKATAKAIFSRLKRWAAFTRYAETGDLPIDDIADRETRALLETHPIQKRFHANFLPQVGEKVVEEYAT
jgi:hypothetical protein